MAPGLLHVTMEPKESLSSSDFHYWYNNEHGPTRLRLPFITTGRRYAKHSAINDPYSLPWLAIYDISDISCLQSEEYLRLRSPPLKSQREIETMNQITVDRRILELVCEANIAGDVSEEDAALVEILLEFQEDSDIENYTDSILACAKVVPEWQRIRVFRFEQQVVVLCSVRPATLDNTTSGELLQSAFTTAPFSDLIVTKKIRLWSAYYNFGPAPRHLSHQGEIWVHYGTRTIPSNKSEAAAVESYVTLPDGLKLPYRLEGSTDPSAPIIVLVNSVMVHWNMWDEFVTEFFAHEENTKYRVLRYLPRGRFPPSRNVTGVWHPVTVDQLAGDIVRLLDALKVKRAECVCGVSLGGATALRTALLYPTRFKSFVACDTNASAPEGNSKAWTERIEIAEKQGAAVATSEGMEAVIGENLAEITIRRWAVPESFQSDEITKRLQRVKKGVEENSLLGFKEQVQALYKYDFQDDMRNAKCRGIFVVGAGDGTLPESMKKMADGYGTGSTLHIVKNAGHLPMVEKPKEVAHIMSDFLNT